MSEPTRGCDTMADLQPVAKLIQRAAAVRGLRLSPDEAAAMARRAEKIEPLQRVLDVAQLQHHVANRPEDR